MSTNDSTSSPSSDSMFLQKYYKGMWLLLSIPTVMIIGTLVIVLICVIVKKTKMSIGKSSRPRNIDSDWKKKQPFEITFYHEDASFTTTSTV